MPSVGTPSSKRDGSTRGAPSAYTDAGPPERITATGFRRRSSSAVDRCETSSEYTRASRTRRAISCEYWPPRSTTSTGRASGNSSGTGKGTTSAPIVGRLLGDRHVVRVALVEAGGADPDEARLGLHLLDRRRAAVAHRLPEAPDVLVEDASRRPLVGDAALDPLGNELLDVLDVTLEVPVLREATGLHGAERAHAAVLLEALALDEDHVPRRLVRTGERRPEHDRVGPGGDRLGDVSRVANSTVGDQRHAGRRAGARTLVDGGDLGHTDAGDDPGSANRAGPHARLDAVDSRIDQRLRRVGGRDVAGDQLGVVAGPEPLCHLDDAARVAVRSVEDENVDAGRDQRVRAIERVRSDADRGSDAEPALRV